MEAESGPQIEATMLLCDAAQMMGGKLYILGGGWSIIFSQGQPLMMALAVKLSVPWDQSNAPVSIRAALVDEDGDAVDVGQGPVQAAGTIEVGRPPGLKAGTALDAPFVLPISGLVLEPGGYFWTLEVHGTERARTPFRVLQPPPGMMITGGPSA
jgi:hypothetical protein